MAETDQAFPTTWEAMPADLQRYLASLIVKRQLAINETPASLLQWLFRGHTLGEKTISYGASAHELWPLVVEEARKWNLERAAHLARLSRN
jgi:hypothetical protein